MFVRAIYLWNCNGSHDARWNWTKTFEIPRARMPGTTTTFSATCTACAIRMSARSGSSVTSARNVVRHVHADGSEDRYDYDEQRSAACHPGVRAAKPSGSSNALDAW